MPILLVDDARYNLRKPKDEAQLEEMVKEHSRQIFGQDSLYFDIKPELRSKAGIGSKPDGFVIVFDEPVFYIVEDEIAEHGVHDHIVTQISKFNTAFKKTETRNKIVKNVYNDIMNDPLKKHFVESRKMGDLYPFLTDLLSSPPTVVIVIDDLQNEAKEAVEELPLKSKIVEFKTFGKGVGLNNHAHLVCEPVEKDGHAKYDEKEKGFLCLMCKKQDLVYNVGEIVQHLMEKHDIDWDDQIIDGWTDKFEKQAEAYYRRK
jgi:hypothetical protein